jgi:hypothetical protein
MVSAYTLNLAACYLIEKYYFNFIDYKRIMGHFGIFLLVNSIISTATYFLMLNLPIDQPLPKLVIAFSFYLLTLLALNRTLKLNEELNSSLKIVFDRLKNKN